MSAAAAITAAPPRVDPRLLEHLRQSIALKVANNFPSSPRNPAPGAFNSLLDLSLCRSAVHEWLSEERSRGQKQKLADWMPPLSIATELASRALTLSPSVPSSLSPFLIWIGRRCWPYGRSLIRGPHGEDRTLLQHSVFVDAPDIGARLWAIDLALRCPAVGVVVADGSGFDMAATRRLALAAAAGNGLALLLRPPWEQRELSAATTRWLVLPEPSGAMTQRWRIEPLRCKGLRLGAHTVGDCVHMEADCAGAMRVLTDLAQRPGEAVSAPARRVG